MSKNNTKYAKNLSVHFPSELWLLKWKPAGEKTRSIASLRGSVIISLSLEIKVWNYWLYFQLILNPKIPRHFTQISLKIYWQIYNNPYQLSVPNIWFQESFHDLMCCSIAVFFLLIDFCGMDGGMSHQNSDVIFRDLVIIKSATFKEVEENNFVLTPGRYVVTD